MMTSLTDTCARAARRINAMRDEDEANKACGNLLDHIEAQWSALDATKPTYPNMWNCRTDVRDANRALEVASGFYVASSKWMILDEAEQATRSTFSLRDLWRMWDAVQNAERDFCELPAGTSTRHKIDVEMDLERARTRYDRAYRVFYGLKARSWEERINLGKLNPPKTKPRDSQRRRAISTYS